MKEYDLHHTRRALLNQLVDDSLGSTHSVVAAKHIHPRLYVIWPSKQRPG